MLARRANSAPSVLRSRGPAAEGPAWCSYSSYPISSSRRPSSRQTMLAETRGDGPKQHEGLRNTLLGGIGREGRAEFRKRPFGGGSRGPVGGVSGRPLE